MNPRPVGVFDSGVGGLTVLAALERTLPQLGLLYLGDTARVPYGTRSSETVRRYALEAAQFLRQHDVRLVVVACNTVSAVALDVLSDTVGVPVVGVIRPGARRALEVSRWQRIGVIGTRATIDSGAYPREIKALEPGAVVLARACPLFVPLAEEGWTDDAVARLVAERYLAPLKKERVDTLVLGCTHYPLLRDAIAEVMGPGVALVDSAEAVADDVRAHLKLPPAPLGSAPCAHRFYVTDAPQAFQHVAERFLGRPIERLERVSLPAGER